MSRNNDEPVTHYLRIKRDGEWELSIQSIDADYLVGRGEEWKRLDMIEDFIVSDEKPDQPWQIGHVA